MSEIAIFGGTFDPPTRAHQAIARACLEQPGLDAVWLMPSGDRSDKPAMQAADARLEMLECLHQEEFGGNSRLVVSDFELQLPQPTQTNATDLALQQAFPRDRFWFVFGADSYQDMPSWEYGEKLQKTLGMLIVPRPGYALPALADNIKHLAITEPEEVMAASSTVVRGLVSQAMQPSSQLICEGVQRYITQRGLYRTVQ
jgi:nicotinate-nucleotide adenylyltransferase